MKLKDSAFLHNLLLIIGSFVFSCADSNASDQEIVLSWNGGCRGNYRLSPFTDSYKIIYPERGRYCAETIDFVLTWTCRLKFETDSFTLRSYEICVDLSRQQNNACLTSTIVYKVGSSYLNVPCNRRPAVKCFGQQHDVEAIYSAGFPCSFSGETRIYLKPKNPPVYALFKDRRQCNSQDDVLTGDHGTIVSEYYHRSYRETSLCPVNLQVKKWKKYKEFCFWFDFAKFLDTNFSIKVSSMFGDKSWNFGGSYKSQQKYCNPDVRGYQVSADLAHRNSHNNHRFILRYSFEKRDGYDDDDDDYYDDDDDDDYFDDDDDSPSQVVITLVVCGVSSVILGLFICCCCIGFGRKGHSRQAATAVPSAPRVTYPPAAAYSSTDESNPVPTAPLVNRPDPVPTAPLVNRPDNTYDPPPSYESLYSNK